jgi:medium-chain acyl-[acyl-carrier-protein] hydrolase
MEELAAPLAEALAQIPGPFVILGHSMGSWLGFDVVRRLRKAGQRLPEMLIVSARRAPGIPDRWPPMHALPESELVDTIQARYGGIPPQVAAERGFLSLFLPTLRADLQVLETWDYQPETPLSLPITACYGQEDSVVSPEEVLTWGAMTRGRFRHRGFPGGHFFFRGPNREFLQELSMLLEEL